MIYGYARASTKTQAKDGNNLEAQESALRVAGPAEVYVDARLWRQNYFDQNWISCWQSYSQMTR